MTLIDTVKKMVFLAPCRCGRTFYKCDIVEYKNQINLKFTPTDEYLSVDPRRED
jgi:hypothetical protein